MQMDITKKRESESLLIAAPNNVIRTNYVKAKINNTQKFSLCDDRWNI